MKDFHSEIERRREERKRQRSNTWINLIIRIIALIFVILIIRYMNSIRTNRINSILFNFNETDSTEIINPEKSANHDLFEE